MIKIKVWRNKSATRESGLVLSLVGTTCDQAFSVKHKYTKYNMNIASYRIITVCILA